MKCLFFATVIAFATLTTAASAASGRTVCCQSEYSACIGFCQQNPARSACPSDCSSRLTACKSSGTFFWINKPSTKCG